MSDPQNSTNPPRFLLFAGDAGHPNPGWNGCRSAHDSAREARHQGQSHAFYSWWQVVDLQSLSVVDGDGYVQLGAGTVAAGPPPGSTGVEDSQGNPPEEQPRGILHDEVAVIAVKSLIARGFALADVAKSWADIAFREAAARVVRNIGVPDRAAGTVEDGQRNPPEDQGGVALCLKRLDVRFQDLMRTAKSEAAALTRDASPPKMNFQIHIEHANELLATRGSGKVPLYPELAMRPRSLFGIPASVHQGSPVSQLLATKDDFTRIYTMDVETSR